VSATGLAAADDVGATGSGSKVTLAVKTGTPGGHPVPELAAPPPPAGLVELWRVTWLTPSISRRRSSVSATAVCVAAQPLTVNVGTLPGGVAEVTCELVAAPVEDPPLGDEDDDEEDEDEDEDDGDEDEDDGDEDEEEDEEDVEDEDPGVPPTVPVISVIVASSGSTRPNSWKACAQSKRSSTSSWTAWVRCSRRAMKLVYGESAPAAAFARSTFASSVRTSARRLETWCLAMP
jgi:hypothetical protein